MTRTTRAIRFFARCNGRARVDLLRRFGSNTSVAVRRREPKRFDPAHLHYRLRFHRKLVRRAPGESRGSVGVRATARACGSSEQEWLAGVRNARLSRESQGIV